MLLLKVYTRTSFLEGSVTWNSAHTKYWKKISCGEIHTLKTINVWCDLYHRSIKSNCSVRSKFKHCHCHANDIWPRGFFLFRFKCLTMLDFYHLLVGVFIFLSSSYRLFSIVCLIVQLLVIRICFWWMGKRGGYNEI